MQEMIISNESGAGGFGKHRAFDDVYDVSLAVETDHGWINEVINVEQNVIFNTFMSIPMVMVR